MRHTFLLLLLVVMSSVDGKRILVLFYHPGPSHFSAFYPLFNKLAERGHNVTVLSYSHVERPHANYNELLLDGMSEINSSITYDSMLPLDRTIFTVYQEYRELYEFAELERTALLESPHIDRILATHNADPFDVVLVELFLADFIFGLVHQLNVPFIGFSTCALPPYYYDIVDQPDIPSYIPFAFSDHSWDMRPLVRAVNWLETRTMKFLFRNIQIRDNQELKARFGPEMPDVAEIAQNISLVLVNQHYSFSGPKPLSNKVIEVGGLHLKPSKPISKHLKEMLDSATQGVVLVSWGSNIKSASIPANIRREMIRGFAKLSYLVIWKWEDEAINELVSDNVYATSWLPQQDILCHPNVKVFWSHGGNSGTIETVHCGKPAIITPFYGDQYLNAAALGTRGMGFKLPLLEITAGRIETLVTLASSEPAQSAAKAVSFEHNNRLASPLDTAVWWVEHVIATSGYNLGRANTHKLQWHAYHSIDSILCLLFTVGIFIFICRRIIRLIFC